MYKKVLVALDGSQLAETALPYAAQLAPQLEVEEVILFSALGEVGWNERRMAEGYLRDLAANLTRLWKKDKEFTPLIRTVVLRGLIRQIPDLIIRFVEDNGIDLVVMSSHGRSGIGRWMIGSVAEKVLRGANVPVFLVRSAEEEPLVRPKLRRLLVPLDGSELAATVLPHAEELGKRASVEVTLLYIAPPNGARPSTPGSAKVTEQAKAVIDVYTYLDSVASALRAKGITVKTKMRTGHPSEEIALEAEEGEADLILMSTHGHTGLARWAFGSVADQVVHASPLPVLLIRSGVVGMGPRHLRGPMVYRCFNCGRRINQEAFTGNDRCPRCRHLLKTCRNCVHYDGIACMLRLPDAGQLYPGRQCEKFEFRKNSFILR